MIRINEIKLPLDHTDGDLKEKCAHILKINPGKIKSVKIARKAVDSRDKGNVFFVYNAD